jgi:excisionase family DNA binding protein
MGVSAPERAGWLERVYANEAEALRALSRACTAYGRRHVGFGMVFTTTQAASILHVSSRTVCKWFDQGRLRGYRIPGSQDRRIPRDQLLRFVRENELPVPPAFDPWNGDLETFTA